MKTIKPWSIALLLLIIIDSIFTVFIGGESNPVILWVMKTFNTSLVTAMIIRIFYCLPLVYILNKTNFSKCTVFLYITVYTILAGYQI